MLGRQIIFSLIVGQTGGCVDRCQLEGLGLGYLLRVPARLLSFMPLHRLSMLSPVGRKGLPSEDSRL